MILQGKNAFTKLLIMMLLKWAILQRKKIKEVAKKSNWKGINKNGPVIREYIDLGMKNNPNYYFIIYHFNGMTINTTKI